MALTKFGFVVTGGGLDPTRHRSVMKSDHFEMIAIGISEPSQKASRSPSNWSQKAFNWSSCAAVLVQSGQRG